MNQQLTEQSYFGLGKVPVGIGAVLKGWHGGSASVLDFRAMTEKCPHNCFHCFTNKRKKTLTLEEIDSVIKQAGELGVKGINYLGEGEPILDKDFYHITGVTRKFGMTPIVFTSTTRGNEPLQWLDLVGALHYRDWDASVCPKCDSLFNEQYQNWVVGDRTGKYFAQRNEAIKILMETGFNEPQIDGTTRMGFDMVVTKRNVDEVEQTLRYCRDNNFWIVFSTYLPAGRCVGPDFDSSLVLSKEELEKMRATVKGVDNEYGFNHPIFNNFATFPCVEFMQVYGNGNVSPCPGNETIVGNVRTSSLKDLADKILEQFPCHLLENQKGYCVYRER